MTGRAMRAGKAGIVLGGAAVLAAAAALWAMEGRAVQESAREYRVAGAHVAVYNLAGAVRVVPGTGDEVVVSVEAKGADAGRLSVESGPIRGTQALRVRYPADRIVYGEAGRSSRTTVRVGNDGTFGGNGLRRGERVDIRGSGDGLEAWADLTIAVPPGQRFSLHLGVGETDVRDVRGDLEVDTRSGSIQSSGTSGPLRVDTGSGTVRVERADGSLEVDTGSGEIVVEEVTGERVLIDTGSGGVRASGIRSESLEVDTGSGRIALLAVEAADIMVDTGSGRVEVDLAADVRRLEVDTGSGGVTLRVPDDLGARLELDTGSGSINVEVPIDERTRRRSHLRGVIGDGQGDIHVDTGSGSIRVVGR